MPIDTVDSPRANSTSARFMGMMRGDEPTLDSQLRAARSCRYVSDASLPWVREIDCYLAASHLACKVSIRPEGCVSSGDTLR